MIISFKNKYIFICVSKTGTTSIENFLLEHDPTVFNNHVPLNGQTIHFKDHDYPETIKKKIGALYDQFNTFAFVRNPHSQWVSSYFFDRQKIFLKDGKFPEWLKNTSWGYVLRVITTKVFPFWIWCLIYPNRNSLKKYLIDQNGYPLVNYVGLYENLNSDFQKITREIGLDFNSDQLPVSNKSKHKEYESYFRFNFVRKLFNRKIKTDLKLYNYFYNKGISHNGIDPILNEISPNESK